MNIIEIKFFTHIKKKITKTLCLIIFSSLIILSCQTTQSTTKVANNNSNIEKTLSDFPITKSEFEENEEIRVGLLLPLKGQNYRIGKSLLNAIHLALYKTQNKNIKIFENLGKFYPLYLKHANLVIGNSSSGVYEAPFYNKISINIGSRQEGRQFAESVISVEGNFKKISTAINNGLRLNLNKKINKLEIPTGNPMVIDFSHNLKVQDAFYMNKERAMPIFDI